MTERRGQALESDRQKTMVPLNTYELESKYTEDSGTVFLTGIQALARLPVEQLRVDQRDGLRTAALVSGYQGSPLGGYGQAVQAAARLASDVSVVFRPGMNEEFAATAIMGSQLASARHDAIHQGVVGVWYGKAPGVDRAADALRHGVFAGASMYGGAIAIVGDDPAAKSSTIPSSSAGLINDMHMPLLYPGDPAEALDLGRHAIALSRATGLWAALKIVADVADATATVSLDLDRVRPVIPLIDGERYHHVPDGRLLTPHTVDIEREIVEVRYELARRYAAENGLNRATVDPAQAWIGIISSGITYREVREALCRLGLETSAEISSAGIRLLKMGMPMPFNAATLRMFARGVEEILIVEEKSPSIESLVKDALYGLADRPIVVGKTDEQGGPLFPTWGSLDADDLVPKLRQRLSRRVAHRLNPEARTRTRIDIPLSVDRAPFFCSGCPHNRSTEVPEGSVVGAGIGCHTMTLLMDQDRVGDIAGLTCMGNEGTQWIGMSDFVASRHMFQNLGDGTFFHSGQLAVQAAIAAEVNITYKLLYNSTVAMTGGQDPEGQLDVPTVARMLLDQGVAQVIVTSDDPARHRGSLPDGVASWHRDEILKAQQRLADVSGVTVLIHDQACAAELRRGRKRGLIASPNERIVINHRVCEGCGDCGEVSNCLSVHPIDTAFGRKTTIDQTSCNLDFSCLEGDCPSFMVVSTKPSSRLTRRIRRRRTRSGNPSAVDGSSRADAALEPPEEFAEPSPVVPADDFAVRITGIGGTGVVTVAQILGTAAMLDGFEVRGLDQIGLSQKAGPVVSDLRLSRGGASFTNRLGEGQADLLLALDQLVAASPTALDTCNPEATVVVGSTTITPTGSMVVQPDLKPPKSEELIERIASRTTALHHWADASKLTEDLLGSTLSANLFVVGMALQAGALPIRAASIEKSIALNRVAARANRSALLWGRTQVERPEVVARAVESKQSVSIGHDQGARFKGRLDALNATGLLRAHLGMLADELQAWGNTADAHGWFDVLDRVAAAERAVDPSSTRLVEAVAAGLFKLIAYKDEYEVARLLISEAGPSTAFAQVDEAISVSWKLHPPFLRSLGMNSKITLGRWATPLLAALASAKRLRGGPFDLFGRAEVRKVERLLAKEYVAAIDNHLQNLNSETLRRAVDLANTADLVRGYEEIKLANVARFRDQMSALSKPVTI